MLNRTQLALMWPLLLLAGVNAQASEVCTASITVHVPKWCDAERWNVPLEVRYDGKPVGAIDPKSTSFGPFEFRRRRAESKIEVWVGKRKLAERSVRCAPESDGVRHHDFVLHGFRTDFVPQVLPFACEGSECYESEKTTRERSCMTDLSLRSAPCCAGDLATELPETLAFYSHSLVAAYRDVRSTFELARLCRDEFPKECSAEVMAHVPNLDQALEITQLITVFDPPPLAVERKSYATADAVRAAMRESREHFREHAGEYDEDLLARYAAVRSVCPEPNPDVAAQQLSAASGAEFMRYRAMSP